MYMMYPIKNSRKNYGLGFWGLLKFRARTVSLDPPITYYYSIPPGDHEAVKVKFDPRPPNVSVRNTALLLITRQIPRRPLKTTQWMQSWRACKQTLCLNHSARKENQYQGKIPLFNHTLQYKYGAK